MRKELKPIPIGLVGLGWVSTHRHLPALKRDPRFEVVGLADRDGDLAARLARKFGVPRHCKAESAAEIDWLPEVQALDVVTSPMTHHAFIRDGLSAGKHVITEKPFAMTLSEGRDLVDLASRTGKQLAIVHNFQFASSTRKLVADMTGGTIGTVRSIAAVQWGNPRRRLPTWYEHLPYGLFYDESPHLLYLVRRLAASPLRLVSVDSCASTLGLQTPASIDASYRASGQDGEIPVTVSCRFESPVSEWHVAVLGDKAAGIVDVFRDIYIRLPNDGTHGAATVLRTSAQATAMHWARHFINGPLHLGGRLLYGNRTVFDRFGAAIEDGQAPLDIGPSDALAVLTMQHEIMTWIDRGRQTEVTKIP